MSPRAPVNFLKSPLPIILFISILFFAFSSFLPSLSQALAANYYVDATNGNDANNGTSELTTWKTIAKVNASSFVPGDQILFKRGGIWREQLNVPSSGANGHPITFGAYGSGANPIISGANVISGTWTNFSKTSTSVYSIALTSDPGYVVMEDNVLLTYKTSLVDCIATAGSFYWAANVLYIHATDGSNPNTNGKVYDSPVRDFGILVDGKNYVIIQYLTVEKAGTKKPGESGATAGINVKGEADNVIVQYCKIRWNNTWGLLSGGTGGLPTNITFNNNEVYGNQFCGIGNSAKTSWYIQYNDIHDNGNINTVDGFGPSHDHGIYMSMNNGGTAYVQYNKSYNHTYGAGYSSGAEDTPQSIIWAYNLSWNNMMGFFAHSGATNSAVGDKVYNFTDYGSEVGFRAGYGGDATGAVVAEAKNIILSNNTSYGVVVAGTGSAITTFTNNDVYGAVTANYSGLSDQTGSDGNINADPLFVSTSTPDFHLQPTSPCIDAGTDVGLTQDYAGNPVPFRSAPDIGAYEYQPPNRPAPPANLRTINP